jgi:DNA repair protein RecO (recombination protein O)
VTGFRTRLYRDDAVVLRTQKLGESDRIITLFTRRHGRVRAVAKGVRRTTSKFGARLEPFGHVDVQVVEGRTLHVIGQVEGVELFGKRFVDDYPRYTAASAIAETAERLTPVEEEPALPLYLLTLGALRALAGGEHAGTLVLDAYLLRAMAYGVRDGGAAPGFLGTGRGLCLPGLPATRRRPSGAGHPRPDGRPRGRRLGLRRRVGGGRTAGGVGTGRGAPAVAPGACATIAAVGGQIMSERQRANHGLSVSVPHAGPQRSEDPA